LPAFKSSADAERVLIERKNQRLRLLRELATRTGRFVADATPDSLKVLESWYFEVLDTDSAGVGVTKAELDEAVGTYVGEVLVETAGFEWIVAEDAFVRGHYGIGVRRGLLSVMLTEGVTPDPLARNRRKQSLFRMYRKWTA
jgi:hypothetical protein